MRAFYFFGSGLGSGDEAKTEQTRGKETRFLSRARDGRKNYVLGILSSLLWGMRVAGRSDIKLKSPAFRLDFLVSLVQDSVLATSYFPLTSIIATTALNCRVRNGIGCDHSVKSPELSPEQTNITQTLNIFFDMIFTLP